MSIGAYARLKRHLGIAAGLSATVALAGVSAAGAASDASITAGNTDANFSPADVTINPGESVTWTFDNPTEPHNVAALSPNWSSGDGLPRANHLPLTRQFTTAGVYTFYCE